VLRIYWANVAADRVSFAAARARDRQLVVVLEVEAGDAPGLVQLRPGPPVEDDDRLRFALELRGHAGGDRRSGYPGRLARAAIAGLLRAPPLRRHVGTCRYARSPNHA